MTVEEKHLLVATMIITRFDGEIISPQPGREWVILPANKELQE